MNEHALIAIMIYVTMIIVGNTVGTILAFIILESG